MKRLLSGSLVTVPTLFFSGFAAACPVCYGANDSPMNAGMNTALMVMLGITGVVLAVISFFFVMLWRRHQRLRGQLSAQAYIDQQGVLRHNDEKGEMEWNNS